MRRSSASPRPQGLARAGGLGTCPCWDKPSRRIAFGRTIRSGRLGRCVPAVVPVTSPSRRRPKRLRCGRRRFDVGFHRRCSGECHRESIRTRSPRANRVHQCTRGAVLGLWLRLRGNVWCRGSGFRPRPPPGAGGETGGGGTVSTRSRGGSGPAMRQLSSDDASACGSAR